MYPKLKYVYTSLILQWNYLDLSGGQMWVKRVKKQKSKV